MANWYGAARTNYVRIKPERKEQLIKELAEWNIHVGTSTDNDRYSLFIPFQTENGDFIYDRTYEKMEYDDNNVLVEQVFDWQKNVLPYLEDGEVLVVVTVGNQKLAYLTGRAVAYRLGHEPVVVDINDIYEKAASVFGVNENDIKIAQG